MKNTSGLLVFLIFLIFFLVVHAVQPTLRSKTLVVQNSSLLGQDWTVAIADLEFDQALYLNIPHLCPLAELSCPPPSCQACDWTTSLSSGECQQSAAQCCGPDPATSSPENFAQWCMPSTGFTTLEINTLSTLSSLNTSQTHYFRFFIPASKSCTSYHIAVRYSTGSADVYASNRYALPGPQNNEWDVKFNSLLPGYGYAQTDLLLCPNFHTNFAPGTWAVSVIAAEPTSFYIEVIEGNTHPLTPIAAPSTQLKCSDTPFGPQYTCVDDGQTLFFPIAEGTPTDELIQFVFPLDAGCQHVSVALWPTSEAVKTSSTDADLFCFATNKNNLIDRSNSLVGGYRIGTDISYAIMCPEEPMWLQCALQPWFPGPLYIVYSTETPTITVPISSVPNYDFSINSGRASSSLVFFEPSSAQPHFTLCLDWYGGCTVQWPIMAGSQPMLFWPVPTQFPTLSGSMSFHSPDSYFFNSYITSDFHIMTLLVIANPENTGISLDTILTTGSIVLRSITNAAREIPLLPNNGPSGFTHFPHVAAASLNQKDIAQLCSLENFEEASNQVPRLMNRLRSASTLEDVLDARLNLDLLANSRSFASCQSLLIANLSTTEELTVLSSEFVCPYQPTDLEFSEDPCCNTDEIAFSCCLPSLLDEPIQLYAKPATRSLDPSCTNPICAQSYFSQLSDALNILLTGSGCIDTAYSQLESSLAIFQDIVRSCRVIAGIGENFQGVACQIDEDCANPPHICDIRSGKCATAARIDVENVFLSCFIDNLSVAFEDWIRTTKFPPTDQGAPKNASISSDFFKALRAILITSDCVTDNILDINLRTRAVYSSSDSTCIANNLGTSVSPSSRIVEGELCPPFNCLDSSCRVPATNCHRNCLASYGLQNSSNVCSQQTCTTSFDLAQCSNSGSNDVCAYCPPSGSYPCLTDSALPITEADCLSAPICELPDGTLQFGLTEAQCFATPSACSLDCAFDSPQTCRSLSQSKGACHLPDLLTYEDCEAFSINVSLTHFFQNQCFLSLSASEYECIAVNDKSPSVWSTCDALSLSQCDGSTVVQRYLQCYLSDWGPCPTEMSCNNAGYCSDRPFAVNYDRASGYFDYGACFSSGYYQTWIPDFSTECFTTQMRTPNGCLTLLVAQATCLPELNSPGFQRQVWLNPAKTLDECLAKSNARSGCLTNIESRTLWYGDTICTDCGGQISSSFTWTPARWRSPVVRRGTWLRSAQLVQPYHQQEDVLSFLFVEALVKDFVEFQTTFGLRSEALCSFGLIYSALDPLVCSCLENKAECFSSLSPLALVGLSNPCLGKNTSVATPSSRVDFSDHSFTSSCVQVQLSEINRASLVIPPPPPSVSFSLGPHSDLTGIVQNNHRYPVGELASNGLSIQFATLDSLSSWNVCLLINLNGSNPDYPHPDFATSSNFKFVVPINVSIQKKYIDTREFWCATLTKDSPIFFGHTANLFAVYRQDEYQDAQYQPYSTTTVALVYTLASLYVIVFIIVLICFTWVVYLKVVYSQQLPIFAWAAPWFLLLCIFRIVYCFAFPDEVWESSEINNFIIFELPTFFYFTAFVIILWSFISVLKRFNPKATRHLTLVLILAVVLIWCLFIATAIAVGVISNSDKSYSPCPGRVPDSSTINDELRALTIAYQSIVIAFIFSLAVGFFTVAIVLVRNVSHAEKSVRRSVLLLKEFLNQQSPSYSVFCFDVSSF